MTCFFHLIGRFGNLLFIYAHARAYCERNGYDLCLPPWIGEEIFDIPKAVRPRQDKRADRVMPEDTHQRQESLIYTRKQVREWFTIKPDVLGGLRPILSNRKLVLLDWRRHQYADAVTLAPGSYHSAIGAYGYAPDQCEWEIDESPTRLPYFMGDVTAAGSGTTWVSLPAFYRMMTAQVHFRANSTFSWWAATLGHAKVYAPIIRGLSGHNAFAEFVEGNWPVMANNSPNTDLHLKEE